MKKFQLRYFGLFIGLVLGIIFVFNTIKPLKKVCIRDVCIRAELAATGKIRQRGLMFRKSMPENRGMLFIFEKEALFGFWMKNMRFPLDIIWIGRNKKIVEIYEYALPCKDVCKTITPQAAALYVLEVNAGFAKKQGIKIGDRLTF
jgi:uncharacterized membrane protein (UPF0127 family)